MRFFIGCLFLGWLHSQIGSFQAFAQDPKMDFVCPEFLQRSRVWISKRFPEASIHALGLSSAAKTRVWAEVVLKPGFNEYVKKGAIEERFEGFQFRIHTSDYNEFSEETIENVTGLLEVSFPNLPSEILAAYLVPESSEPKVKAAPPAILHLSIRISDLNRATDVANEIPPGIFGFPIQKVIRQKVIKKLIRPSFGKYTGDHSLVAISQIAHEKLTSLKSLYPGYSSTKIIHNAVLFFNFLDEKKANDFKIGMERPDGSEVVSIPKFPLNQKTTKTKKVYVPAEKEDRDFYRLVCDRIGVQSERELFESAIFLYEYYALFKQDGWKLILEKDGERIDPIYF